MLTFIWPNTENISITQTVNPQTELAHFTAVMLPYTLVSIQLGTCSAKKRDKNGHSYGILILVFLTSLLIFVTRLEILFFINHYFLVCIFKYCTSSSINYGLET